MKVDPNQTIGGVSARELRGALKRLSDREVSKELLRSNLGLDKKSTDMLWFELNNLGLIEGHPELAGHQLSIAGRAFTQARFTKRMSREQLDKLLLDVISRAQAINSDPELIPSIEAIRVFGSYLDSTQADYGDLDIAVETERRLPGKEWVERSQQRAKASGKQLSFPDKLTYGDREVLLALRGRNGRISLHPMDELKELGISGELVFEKVDATRP